MAITNPEDHVCPKCGAPEAPTRFRAAKNRFLCNSWIVDDDYEGGGGFREDAACLRRQLAAANEKLAEAARLAEDSAKQADKLVGIPNRALEDIRDALNSPMEPSLSRMTHQQLIEEQARVLRLCSAIVDAYFASGEKEG